VAAPEIRVEGFDELIDGSERLSDKIGRSSAEQFRREAQRRAGVIRALMPVDSGLMASSVTVEMTPKGAMVGLSKDLVPYAGWIEFGGIREGGRNSWAERPYVPEGRYIFPTALAAEPQLVEAGTQVAEHEIGAFPWKTPRG